MKKILLIFLVSTSLIGMEPELERLSSDDGFSPAFIFSIFQDGRGFMWFGTLNGLMKYDSSRFAFLSLTLETASSGQVSYN